MKKLIIEIDDKQYEDAINDTEWDTLSLGIYLKEQVKKGILLQTEFEEIKKEIDNITDVEVTDGFIYVEEENVFEILDNHLKENNNEMP